MKTHTIACILDWIFSLMLMASFAYASWKKEKINWSLQFNLINLIASIALVIVAILVETYGQAIRQSSFAIISGYNLWRRYVSRAATEHS